MSFPKTHSLKNLLPAALALAFALAATPTRAADAKPKVGDVFPDLADAQLEGKVPDVKGKVVLIDFWASWCLPCKQSFKTLAELHQKWADQGLVIVGVSVDTKRKDMDAFLKKNPAPFAIVRDAKEVLSGKVDVPTMPTSYVLDRAGKIVAVHEGFHGEESRKQYETELSALLKSK